MLLNLMDLLQEGFEGVNCSRNVDECLSSPCKNNATCTDSVNAFYCNCSAGLYNSILYHISLFSAFSINLETYGQLYSFEVIFNFTAYTVLIKINFNLIFQ